VVINKSELTLFDREYIAIYRAKDWSFAEIGDLLDRDGSTISREYNRNLNEAGVYLPSVADEKARVRKRQAGQRESKCEKYQETIHHFLRRGWTPEQIAGWLGIAHKGFSVSYETIYCFIYKHHMDWAKLLPRKHAPRWTKGMGKTTQGKKEMIPGRTGIDERPEAANNKSEFGHWEGDSIVCSQSVESLNVMVERQTQYVSIRRLKDRGPGETRDAMIASLKRFKPKVRKSITLDNGIEFKWHQAVKKALKIDTYFCRPYHSWEKGLVEQINGLIRRFLPKKTDLSQVTDEEIRVIEYLLNSRPRKLLDWQTPAQVFAKKSGMKLVDDAIAI